MAIILSSTNSKMNWFNILFHNDIDSATNPNWRNIYQEIEYKLDLEGKTEDEWNEETEQSSGWEKLYTYYNNNVYKNTLYGYHLSLRNFSFSEDLDNDSTINEIANESNNYFTLDYNTNTVSISGDTNGHQNGGDTSSDLSDLSVASLLKLINDLRSDVSKWKNEESSYNFRWEGRDRVSGGDRLSAYIDTLGHLTLNDLNTILNTSSYISYDYAKATYVAKGDYDSFYQDMVSRLDNIDSQIENVSGNGSEVNIDLTSYVTKDELSEQSYLTQTSLSNYVTTDFLDNKIVDLNAGFIRKAELDKFVHNPSYDSPANDGIINGINNTISSLSGNIVSMQNNIDNINTNIESLTSNIENIVLDNYITHEQGIAYITHEQGIAYITHEQGISYITHEQGIAYITHEQGIAYALKSELPTLANEDNLGLVKVDNDSLIKLNDNNVLTLDESKLTFADSNSSISGIINYESENVVINNGNINIKTSTLSYADSINAGVVKIDDNTIKINSDGKISVNPILINSGDGIDLDILDDYLTKELADSTYLKIDDAEINYLSKSEAESDYLSKDNANNYLSKTEAATSYISKTELNNILSPSGDFANSYVTFATLHNYLIDSNNTELSYVRYKDLGDRFITQPKLFTYLYGQTNTPTSAPNDGILSSYYTKPQVDNKLNDYVLLSNYNTFKNDITETINSLSGVDTTSFLKQSDLDRYNNDIQDQLSGILSNIEATYFKISNFPNIQESYYTKEDANNYIKNFVYGYYETYIVQEHYKKGQIENYVTTHDDAVLSHVDEHYVLKYDLHKFSYITHEWLGSCIASSPTGEGIFKEGGKELGVDNLFPEEQYRSTYSLANKYFVSDYVNTYINNDSYVSNTVIDRNRDTINKLVRVGWINSYIGTYTINDYDSNPNAANYNLASLGWVKSYITHYADRDNSDGDDNYLASRGWSKDWLNTYIINNSTNNIYPNDGGTGTGINLLTHANWVKSYTSSYVNDYSTTGLYSNESNNGFDNLKDLSRVDWVRSYTNSYINTYSSTGLYPSFEGNTTKSTYFPRIDWVKSYTMSYINTYASNGEYKSESNKGYDDAKDLSRVDWVRSYVVSYIQQKVDETFADNDLSNATNKKQIPTIEWVGSYVFNKVGAIATSTVTTEINNALGSNYYKKADFYGNGHVPANVPSNGILSSYYTKTESDNKFATITNLNSLSNTVSNINTNISNIQSSINTINNEELPKYQLTSSFSTTRRTDINDIYTKLNTIIAKLNEVVDYINGDATIPANPKVTKLTNIQLLS